MAKLVIDEIKAISYRAKIDWIMEFFNIKESEL